MERGQFYKLEIPQVVLAAKSHIFTFLRTMVVSAVVAQRFFVSTASRQLGIYSLAQRPWSTMLLLLGPRHAHAAGARLGTGVFGVIQVFSASAFLKACVHI
jgi:hypothetical protein